MWNFNNRWQVQNGKLKSGKLVSLPHACSSEGRWPLSFSRGAQKLAAAALWVILDPRLRLYTAGLDHRRPLPSEAVLNQGTIRIHLLCSHNARLPELCIMKRMNIAYIYACCLMLCQTCCAFTIMVCLMVKVDWIGRTTDGWGEVARGRTYVCVCVCASYIQLYHIFTHLALNHRSLDKPESLNFMLFQQADHTYVL